MDTRHMFRKTDGVPVQLDVTVVVTQGLGIVAAGESFSYDLAVGATKGGGQKESLAVASDMVNIVVGSRRIVPCRGFGGEKLTFLGHMLDFFFGHRLRSNLLTLTSSPTAFELVVPHVKQCPRRVSYIDLVSRTIVGSSIRHSSDGG